MTKDDILKIHERFGDEPHGFCRGVQNKGGCTCCVSLDKRGVLLLPGEREFLEDQGRTFKEEHVSIAPGYVHVKYVCTAAAENKNVCNCGVKPLYCKLYPVMVPVVYKNHKVSTVTFDADCMAVKILGQDKMLALDSLFINKVVDSLNKLLTEHNIVLSG